MQEDFKNHRARAALHHPMALCARVIHAYLLRCHFSLGDEEGMWLVRRNYFRAYRLRHRTHP